MSSGISFLSGDCFPLCRSIQYVDLRYMEEFIEEKGKVKEICEAARSISLFPCHFPCISEPPSIVP